MAVEKKNWPVDTYLDDTWTDVVSEAATVANIMVCNTAAEELVLQLRVDDGAGNKVATILPPNIVAAGKSSTLNVRVINITAGQRLQLRANGAGIEIVASGVTQ